MWTKIGYARSRGFNVRNTESGWQTAKLSTTTLTKDNRSPWLWSPFYFKSKARALSYCFTIYSNAT